jgi:uncharacterized phage-associated protein/DNA-binding transcriptional regulator YiaG
MKSPITGKEMKLLREESSLMYRKEKFSVIYHCYLCQDTGERFTDDKLDNVNMVQVHNQYREKYGIPFAEEIKAIREKYGVAASKISEILGLGTNTYRLYEAGEMPSVANGRLILSIKEPMEFIKQVEASSHILSPKEKEKFISHAKSIYQKESENIFNLMFEQRIFLNQTANEYSGYKEPDLHKIAQVISFFSEKTTLYKTKLNKLLFYSDFEAYRNTGFSITGISYKAIPFGPVPAEYDKLYIRLCDDDKLSINQVLFPNGDYGEQIKSNIKFNKDLFTTEELEALSRVLAEFGKKNTNQVVKKSHDERAWIENEREKKLISYQKYSFDLIGV